MPMLTLRGKTEALKSTLPSCSFTQARQPGRAENEGKKTNAGGYVTVTKLELRLRFKKKEAFTQIATGNMTAVDIDMK
jgi:hypothetical protein